eukprot:m.195041 g.195041  ORF g.195041 m.195041 type:complete len:51 (-) comp13663_c0_seq11:1312-1464(-)
MVGRACGVTLWELMTYGEQPYAQYKNKEMRRMLRKGVRLEKPKVVVHVLT